ncbi:TIGR04325 family methyltransferase [Pseudomonadales bacterium]|nr:TIGR04325 family methyltransferase [Pseudomonadales bacterium]
MKSFIKLLIPPILLNIIKNGKSGWKGDYTSWQEAQNNATGYDSNEIIKTVRRSLLKVKNGKAVYERDSVLFDEIQYSWQLLAGLMFASAKQLPLGLKVLDFGGSLGSTYYQNKKFLDEFNNVSWSIVEQEHFVNVGKKDFEDDRLKFFNTIDECIQQEKSNILILGSVLQYIAQPFELLDVVLKNNFETILIDRTPFSRTNEKIKLQIVDPRIYEASYPCWFFDELKFISYFESNNYRVVESFVTAEGGTNEYIFKGFVMQKNA